ncbi:MAG: stage II sporulation protein E [Clostridium sp.]
MQYGIDMESYKRVGQEKKKKFKVKEEPLIMLSVFLCGLLVSRVLILIENNNFNIIAPFGIAYIMAISAKGNEKRVIMGSVGVLLGYLSILNKIENNYINIIILLIISGYSLLIKKSNKKIKDISFFAITVIAYLIYGALVKSYDLNINILVSLVNIIITIPIYYVIKYGINCLKEIDSNYFFSTEEIISIGILISLAVAGIGGISLFGVSIRAIFAYAVILVIAFIGGGAYGAAIGVSMGIVIGISSGNMMESIAFYGLAGLISGIFKDTGKIFGFLAYIIMYVALALSSAGLEPVNIIPIGIAGILFFLIPKSILSKLEIEIDTDKKRNKINEVELLEIKKEFTNKVQELGEALATVSNVLKNLSDNENLRFKNASTALIENLADRVCSGCNKCNNCWNRDFNITYNAFQNIIKGSERGRLIFPAELEKTCLNKLDLIKNTDKVIKQYRNNQAIKERLEEGRDIVANHISGIAETLDEMLNGFTQEVSLCPELEKAIRKGLNKSAISYKNVFSYRDINGRVKVKITLKNCGGARKCYKEIIPIINSITNTPMYIGDEGCNIDPVSKDCSIVFEETPKYNIVSYGAIAPKRGEKYIGDTYSFGKTKDGSYMTIISDGIGSGAEAGRESKATIELIEKFIEEGFGKEVTVDMVNSIMAMRFEEEEKYSTLDFNKIDMYSGEASFLKIGGVASFIKRGKKVTVIESKLPPLGIVDKIELDEIKFNVKGGDLIVMVSDGVIDVDKSMVGDFNWLEDFLQNASKDPKTLAGDILDKAKELSGGIVRDDMTVVVSRVYPVY